MNRAADATVAHVRSIGAFFAAALLASLTGAASTQAQSVAEFYRGKAAALNFEVAPMSGEDRQKTVEHIVNTPKAVAARAKRFLE